MMLTGGRTLGVIRQGATTDRTAFSDRVRWLPGLNRPSPRALLALLPDEARLRQARRLLARYPGPVYLAVEEHVANASAEDRVWRLPTTSAVLSLEDALAHTRPGGRLPAEPRLTRVSPPEDISIPEELEKILDHLLPAALKPADKRALDRLAEWHWIGLDDLAGLMALSKSRVSSLCLHLTRLGLVSRVSLDGGPGPPGPGLRVQGDPKVER